MKLTQISQVNCMAIASSGDLFTAGNNKMVTQWDANGQKLKVKNIPKEKNYKQQNYHNFGVCLTLQTLQEYVGGTSGINCMHLFDRY